jgi:spore germination protein KB
MYKEQITEKEGRYTLIIFILGSTAIVGIGGQAKNDAWLGGIVGMLMSVPIIFVYGRILLLYPGKNLFDILDILVGKVFSKIISAVYVWYSFHLGALVIRNFGEFINNVTMPETPIIMPMLCLGLVSILAVRSGVEIIARISAYALPLLLFIIAIVQMLAIPELEFHNIKPILGSGIKPILIAGFSVFSFPFAETVIFSTVLASLKNIKSIYKVYYSGLCVGGGIILFLTLRNILVLGGLLGKLYFPSHVAVSRIRLGNFIERIEVTVAIVFVFGVFIKTAVCLYTMCKGIEKLFNLSNYRVVSIQSGLLMVYLSYILYDNIMEMQFWAFEVYKYYAFPFQVILPVMILIIAKVKARRSKSK